MAGFRVLVVGGYGFFGSRLVERLARHPALQVLVGGRSMRDGLALVRKLRQGAAAMLEAIHLDTHDASFANSLAQIAPQMLVNASGPFQASDYRVAQACIGAGIHYADLADGREYVAGIGALHQAALDAGVFVTSGASSVPALSGAAADHLVRGLSQVRSIDIGISPGNRTERGLSTVQGILSYCGKPLPPGAGPPRFGWSGTHRHGYPAPVGERLLSPCDVPDLALFPARYAGAPDVRFAAGLELRFLHHGMNLMAAMARRGLVRDWSRHAALLKRAADLFRTWGSDAGAMHVAVRGVDGAGGGVARTWQLVATQGHGPFVPTLAAAALVRKAREGMLMPGAFPCVGLLSLEDFSREADGLAISMGSAP